MPHERFILLKPKKKQMMIDSIETIVKEKNFDDISISDITNEAEISRGTFYTYFTDKNDAIFTVLNSYYEKIMKRFVDLIDETKGDFFEAVIIGKNELLNAIKKNDMISFLHNVKFINSYNLLFSNRETAYKNFKELCINIYPKIDIKKYIEMDDLYIIVDLIALIVTGTLFKIVFGMDSREMNKVFEYELAIIKKGIKNSKVKGL